MDIAYLFIYLKAPKIEKWKSSSCSGIKFCTIISVIICTVHGSVAIEDYPGGNRSNSNISMGNSDIPFIDISYLSTFARSASNHSY